MNFLGLCEAETPRPSLEVPPSACLPQAAGSPFLDAGSRANWLRGRAARGEPSAPLLHVGRVQLLPQGHPWQ